MPLSPDAIRCLHAYFDKILVVSVPRFTDRHDKIRQELDGLTFDFFWGADKLQLDLEKIKQDGTYDEAAAAQLQRQGKALNAGEIACSLSHRMVYQEVLKQNWKRVLVLEDDVIAVGGQLHHLATALQQLPPAWELVYLGYLKHEEVTVGLKLKQFFYKVASALGLMKWTYTMVSNLLPRPYNSHLKKAGFHDCTHAYAISAEGARKLLKVQSPVVYRADDLLSHTIMKGELNAFVTEPKFFDQEIFHNAASASEIRDTARG